MKKIILLICFIFIIFSCSSNNKESLIEESSEIINDYVDTLEWSIQDSKEIKNLIETNQNKLKDSINSIR